MFRDPEAFIVSATRAFFSRDLPYAQNAYTAFTVYPVTQVAAATLLMLKSNARCIPRCVAAATCVTGQTVFAVYAFRAYGGRSQTG